MKHLLSFLLVFGVIFPVTAQQVCQLEEVLAIARGETWDVNNAKNQLRIADLENRLFEASLKPSLNLNGMLPGFLQTSSSVTQPNGTIAFERISQNNASLSLFASKEIVKTGTTVFVQSDLQRFDDFSFDQRLYNGVPLRLGISHPIFGAKPLKWQQKIAPIELKQAHKTYAVNIETTQLSSVILYGQILIGIEQVKITDQNAIGIEKLLAIAQERFKLGKISQNDILQLEIEHKNAKLSQKSATFFLASAKANLWAFLGKEKTYAQYLIPRLMPKLNIDTNKAIEFALSNRPEMIAYQKALLEADQSIQNSKLSYGPQANIFASFGLTRGAEELKSVYTNPFPEQQISVSFSIPILNWGQKQMAVERATLEKRNIENQQEQEIYNLKNTVQLKIQEFLNLQEIIEDQEAIKDLANKRFKIANERYILGAISITDWTLSQQEKDQTQRNYIETLSQYWVSYYELRLLTGYDFLLNQKITY